MAWLVWDRKNDTIVNLLTTAVFYITKYIHT